MNVNGLLAIIAGAVAIAGAIAFSHHYGIIGGGEIRMGSLLPETEKAAVVWRVDHWTGTVSMCRQYVDGSIACVHASN